MHKHTLLLGAAVISGLCTQASNATSIQLAGRRWPMDAFPVIDVGKEEVDNIDDQHRPELIQGLDYAFRNWTDNFVAGAPVHFQLNDRGSMLYEPAHDGQNILAWRARYIPAYDCTLATASTWTVPGSPQRIAEVDLFFRDGAGGLACPDPYCWYDCVSAHGPCAPNNDLSFDYITIAAHEAGHAIGLGHYNGQCDYNESIMYPYADKECAVHRSTGAMDNEYARWMYEGLPYDVNEPMNDSRSGATDVGILSTTGTDYLSVDEDRLPGYADIDFFQVELQGWMQGWEFSVYLNPQNNVGTDFALDAYHEDTFLGSVNHYGPGGAEGWVWTSPQSGRVRIGVRAVDFHDAPEPYSLVFQLYRLNVGVSAPGGPPDPVSVFRVNTFRREVTIAQEQEGLLEVFDLSGRRLPSFTVAIPAGCENLISVRTLPRGLYFLRLYDGSRHRHKKMLVVN